jgi:predicted O-methyltransferase YrrM
MDDQSVYEEIQADVLQAFDERIKDVSEMIQSERFFLNGLIRHYKPRKLLEVGVAAGGSSAVILNAIRDMPDSKLISHDYNTDYYRGDGRKSGFLIEKICPELASKWDLRTGGTVAEHIDSIGGDIDFVLLDTMHSNPGEFLDLLMILPYLAKNAVVVIHDISLHMGKLEWCSKCITCGVLFSALKGSKIMPNGMWNHHTHEYMTDGLPLPNIGAVLLDDSTTSGVRDLFHLLSLPWDYTITPTDFVTVRDHLRKHYDQTLVEVFVKCREHYQTLQRSRPSPSSREALSGSAICCTKRISILGIPLIRIKSSLNKTSIRLFGFLPFLKILRK